MTTSSRRECSTWLKPVFFSTGMIFNAVFQAILLRHRAGENVPHEEVLAVQHGELCLPRADGQLVQVRQQ